MNGIFTIETENEFYLTTKDGWEIIDGFVKFETKEKYYDYGTFHFKSYYIPINCIKKIILGDIIKD